MTRSSVAPVPSSNSLSYRTCHKPPQDTGPGPNAGCPGTRPWLRREHGRVGSLKVERSEPRTVPGQGPRRQAREERPGPRRDHRALAALRILMRSHQPANLNHVWRRTLALCQAGLCSGACAQLSSAVRELRRCSEQQ